MLPNKAIEEFQEIYKRRVGEDLSFSRAKTVAEQFLELIGVIYSYDLRKLKVGGENE